MIIGEHNWRLTKHGRERFFQRIIGKPDDGSISDSHILKVAVRGMPNHIFLWTYSPIRFNGEYTRRLITVMHFEEDRKFYLTPRKGGDLIT